MGPGLASGAHSPCLAAPVRESTRGPALPPVIVLICPQSLRGAWDDIAAPTSVADRNDDDVEVSVAKSGHRSSTPRASSTAKRSICMTRIQPRRPPFSCHRPDCQTLSGRRTVCVRLCLRPHVAALQRADHVPSPSFSTVKSNSVTAAHCSDADNTPSERDKFFHT